MKFEVVKTNIRIDSLLWERLVKWHEKIDELTEYERVYLELKAHEKVLFSQLYLKAEGKTNSEREANAYASQEWIDFQSGLVKAHTLYNEFKRRLELATQAYWAAFATMKRDYEAINTPKQGA